jgi:hypothetical protein
LLCERRAKAGFGRKTLAMLLFSFSRGEYRAPAGGHETQPSAILAGVFTGD